MGEEPESGRQGARLVSATKLNQPNASFDVVVCTQVAEYVADVDRV
jgi:hypothetical protein